MCRTEGARPARSQVDPEVLVSGASVLFVPEPKGNGEQNWEWCALCAGYAPKRLLFAFTSSGQRLRSRIASTRESVREAMKCFG